MYAPPPRKKKSYHFENFKLLLVEFSDKRVFDNLKFIRTAVALNKAI